MWECGEHAWYQGVTYIVRLTLMMHGGVQHVGLRHDHWPANWYLIVPGYDCKRVPFFAA
jgi:hypothetical protein